MAVAARIARAATRRDKIAFCGYHGWQDWYLAANLAEEHALDGHLLKGLDPNGVPRGLTGTMLPFRYNDVAGFKAIIAAHGPELAAVVMEPARDSGPAPGFLEEIRAATQRVGAVLIFDEVTSGWRLNTGGIHLTYDKIAPDMAAFAKALGNGYPMAAVIGKREVMEAAQTSFISSTYWTERIGPTAALAMLRKHRRLDVGKHLVEVGRAVQTGWKRLASEAGLEIAVSGIEPLSHLELRVPNAAAAGTLFNQLMLERGFLASGSFYASYAHQPEHVRAYLTAVGETFGVIARAVREEKVGALLKGPVKHSGFQRLT
jgi:glutamate-1-semialdehyde 2,1-aminomutase